MKKTFLLITVLSVVAVFCSCSKAAHITPVTRGISFTAELTYYNESYIALVTVSKNGDTDIAFTAPDTLNGLMLHFSESGVTAKYNGLEYKYDISSVPDGIACSYLYKILNDAAGENAEVTAENDCYYTESNGEKLKYRMYLGATGLPISAKDERTGFCVLFKNVTVLQ